MKEHRNTPSLAPRKPPESLGKAPRCRPHRASRPQLLTRDQLDGRTSAAKVFDRLVTAIEADLGGADQLSAIERNLVQAFAGAAVTLHHLNAQLMAGHEINLAQHAQAVSAMVRVASRLGLQRRQKDVGGLTLGDLLRADIEERQRAADAEEAAEQDRRTARVKKAELKKSRGATACSCVQKPPSTQVR